LRARVAASYRRGVPLVDRYAPWQVAPAPPPCSNDACRRWLLVREGTASGELPDRFLVDPTTPVERRVAWLLQLVEEGSGRDGEALSGIARVCERYAGPGAAPRALAQRLLDAQNSLIAYVPDPGGEEVFQAPYFSYFARTGDCEDKAVFFAAVARVMGLESDVVWIDQRGAANNHVTARVCLVHRRGEAFREQARPWDDRDPGRVRVTGPRPPAGCRYAWAEPTLLGALVGENPYDVLHRIGTGDPARRNL
jgi:transglutaminase-like putative cysteine protease